MLILEIAAGVALAPILVWLASITVLGCLLLLAGLFDMVRAIIFGIIEMATEFGQFLVKVLRRWCVTGLSGIRRRAAELPHSPPAR